jgi:peptidoglycan hydrolase-like protein with peptidoglycan-binding domain
MSTLQQVIDQNLQIPYGEIASSPLSTDEQLCREIQAKLSPYYYNSQIDGIYGGITRAALREFKEEKGLTGGDILGPTTAKFLLRQGDGGAVFDPGPGLENLVRGVYKQGRRYGLTLRTQIAYIMATVEHETAATYRPIREFGGSGAWYAPYYGRGYVQLTHRSNYQKYSEILGVDLVSNPDRALERSIALFVLVHGMAYGIFTGRRLGEYVNVNQTDFYNARRVVNGTDRAQHIANLANLWLDWLNTHNLELAVPEAEVAATLEFIDENSALTEEERFMLEIVMSS